jgi:uncharacterized membrane protein YdbT with pleckstrin-like domain
MSYVDKSLLPGEQVTYRTHLHKIVFAWPAVLVLLSIVVFVGSSLTGLGVLLLLAALISGLGIWVRYTTSEFAVTNKRVIIKVGLISRRTLEMLLSKIEAVAVDQGIGGRVFDYGTITVTGTGGTNEPFRQIAGPLEFRRAVQAATV